MSKKLSRDEQLDKAIAKAKAAEDWQLVEWLRAARGSEDSARWFTQRINQLKAENEQLREQLAKARDPQRIGGRADPESFVYAIEQLREFRWQHATNDEDAIPYINNVAAAHERENAKLRALVRLAWECTHTGVSCDDCRLTFGGCTLRSAMRELGLELGK